MADERLVMEVMCEDPALSKADREGEDDVKDYQEGELEGKRWHEEHGHWADVSEEEQTYQEVIYDDVTGQIFQCEHVVPHVSTRSRL